ncbi:MAG: DHH family phosphoesterase [bacterium]
MKNDRVNAKKLISLLKKKQKVYIQTHNFPDHDAVSSAYALQYLLEKNDIDSRLIYHGEILRESLQNMIDSFKIDIRHHYNYEITEEDSIVIVDGSKGKSNVAELRGRVVAVIDHHEGGVPTDVPFTDIRSSYGACVTIIFGYFAALKLEPSKAVASAMLTGVNFDTHNLMRNVSEKDIEAFAMLHGVSDMEIVRSLVRNNLNIEDLPQFRYLIDNVHVRGNFAFCYFGQGINKNLLAILSDFLLTLEEIEFVALCTRVQESVHFSVRSSNAKARANNIIQKVLEGLGSGGGHADMAGGFMKDINDFDEDEILNRFLGEVLPHKDIKIKIAR